MDGKGRMSVPSAFRSYIATRGDGRMMVTNYVSKDRRCLEVYPFEEWQKFLENVRKLNRFDPRRQALEDFYVAGARDCFFDAQGRILVPPSLRKYAGLGRDVVVTGATDRFRIWAQEVWAQQYQEAQNLFNQDPNFLSDLAL